MAHDKVYGYCENLCNVEVEPKSRTEALYNENLLINCDDFMRSHVKVGSSNYMRPNIDMVNMNIFSGLCPEPNTSSGEYATSGKCTMKYRRDSGNYKLVPATLQTRINNVITSTYVDKVYVFETGDEVFSETISFEATTGIPSAMTVTLVFSMTKTAVEIAWNSSATFQRQNILSIMGIKFMRGRIPREAYDPNNTTMNGNLMLNLSRDVAKGVVDNKFITRQITIVADSTSQYRERYYGTANFNTPSGYTPVQWSIYSVTGNHPVTCQRISETELRVFSTDQNDSVVVNVLYVMN